MGFCDVGLKKSYCDGEIAVGFALARPWGALSSAKATERRVREEKKRKMETLEGIFSDLLMK